MLKDSLISKLKDLGVYITTDPKVDVGEETTIPILVLNYTNNAHETTIGILEKHSIKYTLRSLENQYYYTIAYFNTLESINILKFIRVVTDGKIMSITKYINLSKNDSQLLT